VDVVSISEKIPLLELKLDVNVDDLAVSEPNIIPNIQKFTLDII